jgi:hypothetical protein
MKFIYSIFFLLLSNVLFAQPTRREIIEHKIKSVRETIYEELNRGQNEYTRKRYYSVNGDDSLEYVDNILMYTFTPEINEGKIRTLTRKTADGKTDEIHVYEYKPDGSYTIEIIAHGAGTILVKEFNPQNDCLGEIFSGTDTLAYSLNSLGKIQEIKMKNEGVWKIVGTTKFDDKGLLVELRSMGEPSDFIKYKNNGLGLPEERNEYHKTDSEEILVGRAVIVYEFWK